jgi:PAS domain S-box-containing protein
MSTEASPQSPREFLAQAGQVGHDLLEVDWPATPLGPIEEWPHALVGVIRVLLTSRFAMWMAWGAELTFLCNDAYRRDTLGQKYPWALGQPAREVWAEIWPEIGPRIESVLSTGQATWDEALMLVLERSGYPEETYHTFSYSPLAGDDGAIQGMLCVVSEDTRRVITQRRMSTLRELSSASAGVREEPAFLQAACQALAENPRSLPFTLVYLFDEGEARLAGSSGIEAGHPAAPEVIASADPDGIWPLAELAEGRSVLVALDGVRCGELPTGAWDEPPVRALALPLLQAAPEGSCGFFVAGLNRYCELDPEYRSFLELIAQQLSAGLAAARLYDAERRRAAQLEEQDRAKTTFLSNVSHEFRIPLTLMLGPLQDALGDPVGLPPDRLELVHRNTMRLLKLVNGLLDFSRAEAGRIRAEFRPTDVAKLTADLAGTFREATDRGGVELVVECEPPAQPVYLDGDLWERIVLNLLSNALKATLQGSIEVRLRNVNDHVELSVKDTGTGIEPAERERLFQRFHRVRSPARSYEGTGIGLALVKELTELHGGEVAASSTVGEGSEFTVTLSFGSSHLPPDQVYADSLEPAPSIAALFVEEAMSWIETPADRLTRGALPAMGAPGRAGTRSRVLIADDNPDLRRYLATLLAPQFEVEAVSDGNSALNIIRERPPDLLICDVMMPGRDGHQVLEALRSAPETQDLPIILLSARAGEEAAIAGLQAGADDYLPKPFSGRELLARVRAHLELSALRREAAADLRAEQWRLEQTIQQMPAGVMLAEAPSRRIVLSNRQAAEILGHGIRPHEGGEYDGYALYSLERERLKRDEGPLARAMLSGEVVEDQDMLYVRGDGRTVVLRISAAPVRDEAGAVVGGVLVFQDVTERVRTEQLLAAQRDILALIASGVSLQRVLESIVHTMEELSDSPAKSAIMLLSADGRHLVHGASPSLPAAYREAAEGLEIGPDTPGSAAYTGETVVITDTNAAPGWEPYRDLAQELGIRVVWSTPVRADDGELVGTLGVFYEQPTEPSDGDRRVVDLLARTAGVAIGRARDVETRTRRLEELQSSLLPRDLPQVPGLRAAVSFHPAERGLDIGGDFYDLFGLPGEAWGFVIGDVCGHGAEAAAVTALTRHTTRAIARLVSRPADVLRMVNEELRASDHDRFCTALYGRLDPVGSGIRLTLACGGHPPPLVRRASGAIEALREHGPLLGVFAAAEFPEVTVDLQPRDTLLVYTDGLIERNPHVAGDGALRRLLASLEFADVDELIAQIETRALGGPTVRLPDDTAVLAIQVTAPAPGGADIEGAGIPLAQALAE